MKRLKPDGLIGIAILTVILCMGWLSHYQTTYAQGPTSTAVTIRDTGVTTDSPPLTITTGTVDTPPTQTPNAHKVDVQFKFGTPVAGSYTTCTVQTKTSFDNGSTYQTLGTAVTVTATTGTVNDFTIIEQWGTTTVTTSSASSTAALGFGDLTKFTFACSGYGTSIPVTVRTIYR